jgi:hypothetical protein
MLRLLVLLLLLANGAYFAWSRGGLAALGFGPARQDEPQRLAQQIEPQRLRLLKADEIKRQEAASAPTAAIATECLRAGLFDERQAQTLRQALQALPADSWTLEPGLEPARWIVYMGRYDSPDALVRKRAELRARNVRFEPLTNPALEPGLSLGAHPSEAAATQALAELTARGVRTARVLQEQPEQRGQWLRLPAADAALRVRVEGFRASLAGKALRPCP